MNKLKLLPLLVLSFSMGVIAEGAFTTVMVSANLEIFMHI